jgi:hypothetical protein
MLWQTLSQLIPCHDVVAIITILFIENITPGRWFYSHMTEQYYRLQEDLAEEQDIGYDNQALIDNMTNIAGIIRPKRIWWW